MTRQTFEPNAWSEAFRGSFTPVQKAQKEGLKALERLVKFQHAVADQCLQNSFAQAQVALSSRDPSEIMSRQAELRAEFIQWLSSRALELTAPASEAPRESPGPGGENTGPSESAEPQETEESSTPRGQRPRQRRNRAR
jgi:hypothetical protein